MQNSESRLLLFGLLLILSACSNPQKTAEQRRNDSIFAYLDKAENLSLTTAQRNRYNAMAFSKINLVENDSVTRYFLYRVALNYCRTRHKAYNRVSRLHYKKSEKVKDTLNISRYYLTKSESYWIVKEYDSAFFYCLKSEKLCQKIKEIDELSQVYFIKGVIQFNIDDYLAAEYSMDQAYNLIKGRKPTRYNYRILIQLGNIYHNLKNYKKAIETHQQALDLALKLKLSSKKYRHNFEATCLNKIGNAYKEMGYHKIATHYFQKALANKKYFKDDPLIFAYLYTNLGYCQMQQSQYTSVPALFNKAIKIYDSLGVKNECAISYMYLSDYYARQKDTLKAIEIANKALKAAKDAKAPYYQLLTLTQAGSVNHLKAPDYLKQYEDINDSLQFAQRSARSQFYKIQLETQEITQEKEKAVKEKWLVISIISTLLVIAILLFIIYRQRARQKLLKSYQQQQQVNVEVYELLLDQQAKMQQAREAEKKRIALELHDSVMNRLASIRMNLFVLSKQKDPQTIQKSLEYADSLQAVEKEIENVSEQLDSNKDLGGFRKMLESLMAQQAVVSNFESELFIQDNINLDQLPGEIRMHLYRIIQELLANTHKHARAQRVSLVFSQNKPEQLEIVFQDDGQGFDTGKQASGIGLQNIRQRVILIGGEVEIASNTGKGMRMHVSIPFRR